MLWYSHTHCAVLEQSGSEETASVSFFRVSVKREINRYAFSGETVSSCSRIPKGEVLSSEQTPFQMISASLEHVCRSALYSLSHPGARPSVLSLNIHRTVFLEEDFFLLLNAVVTNPVLLV